MLTIYFMQGCLNNNLAEGDKAGSDEEEAEGEFPIWLEQVTWKGVK